MRKDKILLCCSAGMSTSILVEKIKAAAEAKGNEAIVTAMPLAEGIKVLRDWDVVLLGPQVRFQLSSVKKAASEIDGLPVDVIAMKDYGTANGPAVYDMALALIDKKGV